MTSQTPDKRLLELRALALGRRIDGSDAKQLRWEVAGVIDELIATRARIAELEQTCKTLYADAHGDGFDSGASVTYPAYHITQNWSCGCGATSETDARTLTEHWREVHEKSEEILKPSTVPARVSNREIIYAFERMKGCIEPNATDWLDRAASALTRTAEWVAVDDQRPPMNRLILTTSVHGFFEIGYWDGFLWRNEDSGSLKRAPRAWCELPSRYVPKEKP